MKSILFNNACVITAYFLVFRLTFPSLKEISRVVTFFLALFNFQVAGLSFLPEIFFVSLRRLNYYITHYSNCQAEGFQLYTDNYVENFLQLRKK